MPASCGGNVQIKPTPQKQHATNLTTHVCVCVCVGVCDCVCVYAFDASDERRFCFICIVLVLVLLLVPWILLWFFGVRLCLLFGFYARKLFTFFSGFYYGTQQIFEFSLFFFGIPNTNVNLFLFCCCFCTDSSCYLILKCLC